MQYVQEVHNIHGSTQSTETMSVSYSKQPNSPIFAAQTTNHAPAAAPKAAATRCNGYDTTNTSELAAEDVALPLALVLVDEPSRLDWADDRDDSTLDCEDEATDERLDATDEIDEDADEIDEDADEMLELAEEEAELSEEDAELVVEGRAELLKPLVLMGRMLRGGVGVTLSDWALATEQKH